MDDATVTTLDSLNSDGSAVTDGWKEELTNTELAQELEATGVVADLALARLLTSAERDHDALVSGEMKWRCLLEEALEAYDKRDGDFVLDPFADPLYPVMLRVREALGRMNASYDYDFAKSPVLTLTSTEPIPTYLSGYTTVADTEVVKIASTGWNPSPPPADPSPPPQSVPPASASPA